MRSGGLTDAERGLLFVEKKQHRTEPAGVSHNRDIAPPSPDPATRTPPPGDMPQSVRSSPPPSTPQPPSGPPRPESCCQGRGGRETCTREQRCQGQPTRPLSSP